MTSISKPIVFFGTEDFSLGTLETLINAGQPIAAVVTKPDSPQGRGQRLTPPPVKVLAAQHSIPVWQPRALRDIAPVLKKLNQPLGVLVSYGKIIPQEIIDLFTPGIINIHPSLLPKYRGPSPIESAILHGDTKTGVSIMQLSAAMDAGPVYTRQEISLNGHETAQDLYTLLGTLGTQKLLEILPSIADGTLLPTSQNDAEATYCHLIKKTDGQIDWTVPAAHIERQIRAYHIWPQCRTTLGSVDVIVGETNIASVISAKSPGTVEILNNQLYVHASDTALLIKTVKPLGKKEMPVQAFLSGYRSQLNAS